MMDGELGFLLLGHLVAMYMAVGFMVVYTQRTLALRKTAFSALSRSF